MEKLTYSNAIGIDFGNSKSTLSIWANGHTEIILNGQGERYTPSYVCYTNEERLTGDIAITYLGKYPWNSIYSLKRLIGTKVFDPSIKDMIKTSSYKIGSDDNSKIEICVNYKEEQKFIPEQIASLIFGSLKACAESFLNHEVNYAVLSVPSTFSIPQIEALKVSASISGLCIMNTISEGALAGTEYAWKTIDDATSKLVLFINIGGGYLDISLCNIQSGSCFVICTSGCEIGGIDIDNILIMHCAEEFRKKTGIDIKGNYKALRKLRMGCENAKKVLSSITDTVIDITYLAKDEDFTLNLSRKKFEELNKSIFERYQVELMKILTNSGISKEDLHEIILLGGGSRIPKIKEIVKTLFGRDPMVNINADEAVANGAAIHAALLTDKFHYHGSSLSKTLSFNDVLAFDIEIHTNSNITTILTSNTAIPTKNKVTIKIDKCNKLSIYQRMDLKDVFITSIVIKNTNEINVTMETDQMGIISINLEYIDELNTPVIYKEIIESQEILMGEKLDKIIKQENEFKLNDIEFLKNKESRNELEKYCNDIKEKFGETHYISTINANIREVVLKFISETITWYEGNPLMKSIDYINKMIKMKEIMNIAQSNDAKKLKQFDGLSNELKELIA